MLLGPFFSTEVKELCNLTEAFLKNIWQSLALIRRHMKRNSRFRISKGRVSNKKKNFNEYIVSVGFLVEFQLACANNMSEAFTEVEQDGDVSRWSSDSTFLEREERRLQRGKCRCWTISTKKRGRPPKSAKDSDAKGKTAAKAKTAAKSKSTPAKPKTAPAKIFEEWENLIILDLWKTTYYMRLKEELTSNQVIYTEFVEELANLPEPVTGLTN
jgi:hypothetical protein